VFGTAHNGGPIWGRLGEIGAIARNNPLVRSVRPGVVTLRTAEQAKA
jgi:F0F1-type ATP synthase epsilon subunit